MRRLARTLLGLAVGLVLLAAFLIWLGAGTVIDRATAVAPWALAAVIALVVLEGLADGIGVWASVAPLDGGLAPARSVRVALAGDFFDVLSPAGPVSSEPIVARFIGVETGTGYADALGVRAAAKYVKAAGQAGLSALLGVMLLFAGFRGTSIVLVLAVGLAVLAAIATLIWLARPLLDRIIVALGAPIAAAISGRYLADVRGDSFVAAALARFWARIAAFRSRPALLALIVGGGLIEQVLTACAIWVALGGTGTSVALLPVIVIVPLPQVATVVPMPGSLGTYDAVAVGGLVLATGATAAAAGAAVLVVRSATLPVGLLLGGASAAGLRGWRPTIPQE